MIGNTAETLGIDAAAAPQFVINLCASTSPMALSHPTSPELKRYTFFVSRQREEGRERFRLHMGYFATQEEAEALLAAVRDVYPAAWAGPAPASGVGRRSRAARPAPAPVAAAPATPAAAAEPAPPPAAVQQAAPAAPAAPPRAEARPAAVAAPVVAAPPAVPPTAPAPAPSLETMSNVRDVLARLGDEAPPAAEVPKLEPVKAAPAPAPAELSAAETLDVLETPTALQPPQFDAEEEPDVRVMTPEDTQTLKDIRLDEQNNEPRCFAVQLVWAVAPIDTASLPHLAIFDAYTLYNVEGNRQGRKWYGLRLGFFSDPNSARQVAHYVRSDFASVAIVPVAIKERDHARGGTPEGVKASARLGEAVAPLKPEVELKLNKDGMDGFELLADDRPAPVKRDLDDAPAAKASGANVPAAKAPAAAAARPVPKLGPAAPRPAATPQARRPAAPPPKATGKPTGKRVVVRKKPDAPLPRAAPGAPTPLESTLEILGASTLTLDEGREIINDSAVRKPVQKKPAPGNRFSKLLSRLGGG